MNIHLVWFRNDLRLHDHRPLTQACLAAEADGGSVLPLYVVDPRHFANTRFGFPRIGEHRRRFLRQSLADLNFNLARIGGSLTIQSGPTENVIADLMKTVGPVAIYFHDAFASEERSVQQSVIETAKRYRIDVQRASADTLFAIEDLPFSIDEIPEVFTKYRRVVEKKSQPARPIDAVVSIPGRMNSVVSQSLDDAIPEVKESAAYDDRAALRMVGGETAGLARIKDYLWKTDSIARYKETRNGMLGADYSSKFSPWLALGCVSARQIAAEVQRYEQERIANDSTYWMIFELLWRDYFALMVAKHGSHVFQVQGLRRQEYPWKQDRERFELWRTGQTGYPLIDANMRELAATGFQSNRGRQNVGSFLTKNLGIDWRMGAEWFESQLIDYDPSSNYGNWNYVAGVGNDARGFRWFNTIKQAKNYDADGSYVRHWCRELSGVPDDLVHEPWRMSTEQQSKAGCVLGVDYPMPIVDLFKSADHHQRLYDEIVDQNS